MANIAIIGGGITGLGAAWALDKNHDVTIYEAEGRLGGHANTFDVEDADHLVSVDTAFVVYNTANYPNFARLLDTLDVPTEWSDMSFSWSIDRGRLEFQSRAAGFFAQSANLVRPRHWQMLADYRRFCRQAPLLSATSRETLGEYLEREQYGKAFRMELLAPLIASVWSSGIREMLEYPAVTMIGFLQNHAVLDLGRRQRWRAITGGSRVYVDRITAGLRGSVRRDARVVKVRRDADGVTVVDALGNLERFDHVVFATHADTTLALLGDDATTQERDVLGAYRFQPNDVVLHRDPALMPRRERVWSAWNYVSNDPRGEADPTRSVSVTYWMNRLQNLSTDRPVFISVNPMQEPRHQEARFSYSHPLFDQRAIDAQGLVPRLQGRRRAWFAGAWTGSGFHEDGLRSGLEVAAALGSPAPWGVAGKPALVGATA